MKIADLMEETFIGLSTNKARSALTILGIVIGIASVIAMTAIGQGASSSIQSSITSAGSNLLYVTPGQQRGVGLQVSAGRGSAQTLTQDDADAIGQDISGIQNISPELSRRYQVTAKGTNTNTSVTGVEPAYLDVHNFQIDEGVFITDADVKSQARVAVIGPTTRDDLFGEGSDPVGATVKINKVEFKIVGMTVAKGGSGFSNPDDAIYVPISTAQRYLSGQKYVSNVTVQAEYADQMSTIQQEITNLLLERHKISDPTQADFTVMN